MKNMNPAMLKHLAEDHLNEGNLEETDELLDQFQNSERERKCHKRRKKEYLDSYQGD